ncbi:hypothetical protein HPB50_004891 [Hyalomma asiaticum]|uniref:Uncharacterized protein n=1 Tax=Hyalomma asiaticum TaxID=266040 RepID=A0ACB7SGT8_HYAAI|nr:hypothetical protein HPB50_004891 [Hyalomma asiaticum]
MLNRLLRQRRPEGSYEFPDSDDQATARQWLEIQKLRKKVKRKVDTRASKGRKIRYDVIPKLVNFMAPLDRSTYSEEANVAELFAVGRSTVNVAYRELCEAVVQAMEREWIRMPTVSGMVEHIREFTAMLEFPQAIGALDGCHFPVSPPKENATDYRNYKGWYSIILLALVDHRYRFLYINVGSPGHDAYVYHRSMLADAVKGPMFRQPLVMISGTAVPPLILCDQAFPLTRNLIKPFSHRTQLSAEQRCFNYNLSKARRTVENAFGRLKARFRSIMKRMECDIDNARLAIRACCVLNNVCGHFGDSVLQRWLIELQNSDNGLHHSTDVEEGTGSDVRAALVRHFQQS